MRELILGGQKSGNSGAAKARAAQWLAAGPTAGLAHSTRLLATKQGPC